MRAVQLVKAAGAAGACGPQWHVMLHSLVPCSTHDGLQGDDVHPTHLIEGVQQGVGERPRMHCGQCTDQLCQPLWAVSCLAVESPMLPHSMSDVDQGDCRQYCGVESGVNVCTAHCPLHMLAWNGCLCAGSCWKAGKAQLQPPHALRPGNTQRLFHSAELCNTVVTLYARLLKGHGMHAHAGLGG